MRVEDEVWFQKWMAWRTRPKVYSVDGALTVQGVYKSMLRDLISPELREMGFKGSSGRFAIPAADRWALLGLQKSAHSDSLAIEFTVNLAVVKKSDWADLRQTEPFHPQKPGAQLGTNRVGSEIRLGQLYPEPSDKWWLLTLDSNPTELSYEVLEGISQYGVPWMHDQMNEASH